MTVGFFLSSFRGCEARARNDGGGGSRHCERSEAIQLPSATRKLDCFVASLLAMTVERAALYKKLCGSTSTSSFRLPLVFGPTASHSRKYSDRSTLRSDFTSRRKR